MMANDGAGGVTGTVSLEEGSLVAQAARVKAALAAIEREMLDLQKTFQGAGGDASVFERRLEGLIATKARLTATSERLAMTLRHEAEMTTVVAAGMDGIAVAGKKVGKKAGEEAAKEAGKSSAAMARGVLEFSRGFEDLIVAGPLGIMNNIPVMFMNIGQAAGWSATMIGGLTAGVSLLGTGAFILYRQWDNLVDALVSRGPETAAEEMERLGKATSKTAEETERLAKLKREAAQVEQQMRARPEAEREGDAAGGKALAEGPFDSIRARVLEAVKKEVRTLPVTDVEVEARVANVLRNSRGQVDPAEVEANIRKGLGKERLGTRDRIAEEETTRLLREAQFGEGGLGAAARRRLAEMDPELGREFERTSPEGRLAARMAEQEALGENRRAKKEKEQDAAKAARALADQDAGAVAGDQVTKDAFAKVKEMQDKLDVKAGMNAERNEAFRDASDLNWRLFQMMNPDRVGQSMSIEQFGKSFKATSGIPDEVKELRAANKLLADIAQNLQRGPVVRVGPLPP